MSNFFKTFCVLNILIFKNLNELEFFLAKKKTKNLE